ncbi:MAG TPA: iron-containing redox enzyme family protein [Candidatus Polarisedimenticolia bacterium]|jgi:pyrroloquinoline-quinone synthase|nr:iron-containing redox enzyme family protein [Candidatus Polarisedimenticolia bacterium]
MDRALLESLLSVMDRKDHWAYSHFSEGRATRPQLLLHYQQEHVVYVRDFPVLLSRVHARCPHPEVRQDLAENLYEEETGGLSKSKPHPELFLEMMQGLGFTRKQFESIDLIPEAMAYRAFIDQVTTRRPWIEGALVVTIFIEGSREDRREVSGPAGAPASAHDPEPGLREHFLVRYYGVDPRFLDLKRAHAKVESGHRRMAWKMVLDHARSPQASARLRKLLEQTLALWLLYRDGVARAAGIHVQSSQQKIRKIK